MKTLLPRYTGLYLLALLFVLVDVYLMEQGVFYLNALPIALLLVYMALYHFEVLFLLIAFCTPLSVNIESFTEGEWGLFLPTEPLLFGALLLLVFQQVRAPLWGASLTRHPITIIFMAQLVWIAFTTTTSEYPLVSAKFLLTKLWFIIPLYFYGVLFFTNTKRIVWFLGLYTAALTIVIVYTLSRHALNGFDEETGHWVMAPFFKDHTSYGAILALYFPVLLSWLWNKKNHPAVRVGLLLLTVLFACAIVLSYTRAAWGSLLGALIVYLLIRFKINFKYVALAGVLAGGYIAFSWTSIMHTAEKNNSEHATEDMGERLESMVNVTTDNSNLERLNRWGSAVRLWQERPLVGWGPGTYAMVYAPFQLSSGKTLISTNSGDKGNAHSEYLGPLSEQGIPGVVLLLLLVGYTCYTAIRLYNRMPKGELKRLVLALFLGLTTYYTHGILNNYLDTDKATVPVWGFTAIIVALDLTYPSTNSHKKGTRP